MATSAHIPISLSRAIAWVYAYDKQQGMFRYHWDSLPDNITIVQSGILSGIVAYQGMQYHVIWHRGLHNITPL